MGRWGSKVLNFLVKIHIQLFLLQTSRNVLKHILHKLGRDDFNFSSWILSASPHIAPVTERNTLDYMVLVWGVCYTPHKRYPCDRIFSRECKNRFWGFLLLISDLMLAIFTKTSSVTKRNIMDGVDKVVGMAYTPHQLADCPAMSLLFVFWQIKIQMKISWVGRSTSANQFFVVRDGVIWQAARQCNVV